MRLGPPSPSQSIYVAKFQYPTLRGQILASSPGHSQILSRSCGENSAVEEFSSQLRDKIGSGLGTRLGKYMIKRQWYSGPFVLGEGSFFYLLGNDSKDIFTCILHTAADSNSFLSGGGTEATSHEN